MGAFFCVKCKGHMPLNGRSRAKGTGLGRAVCPQDWYQYDILIVLTDNNDFSTKMRSYIAS